MKLIKTATDLMLFVAVVVLLYLVIGDALKEVNDMPTVHISSSTGKCVKAVSAEGVVVDCDTLLGVSKYYIIKVQ